MTETELVRCTRGHTVSLSTCTLVVGTPHCPLCKCRIPEYERGIEANDD